MRRILALALVAGSSTACIGFAGLGDDPDSYGRKPTSLVDAATNADGSLPDSGTNDASVTDTGRASDVDACVSEPAGELSARLCGARVCGPASGTDGCGAQRTVQCGTCGSDLSCDANGSCECTPESNVAFCTRLGAACGGKSGTDNCGQPRSVASCGNCPNGGTCDEQNRCAWVGSTGEFGARTAGITGGGLNNCGPYGDDNCARSPLVTGGTFYRGLDTAHPASISDFRLDKYEVTVGRFRKFVDAWVAGWRPLSGSGKHTHLNGGSGLATTAGGTEPGWNTTWTNYVGAPATSGIVPTGAGSTTKAEWDTNLNVGLAPYATWTASVDANEKRPMNCLSWYDLHAFCIWDGGFLPSEAEWEYAAAGGNEERTYAWGDTAPADNTALAIYGCYYNGSPSCSGFTNIAPVGSVAAGAGRWGQLDLTGNVFEWSLDWYQGSYAPTCTNCTNLTADSVRVVRGGSFSVNASTLPAAGRYGYLGGPAGRDASYGGRCARSP